jgi:outer membrane protein assembly factor BamB
MVRDLTAGLGAFALVSPIEYGGVADRLPRGVARVRPRVLIALALTALLCEAATAWGQLATSPWPMFQRDLGHRARSTSLDTPQPTVKWTLPTALAPASPAVGSDGTIYLPAGQTDQGQGTLHAVNPNGTQKWAFALPGPPGSTAPAIGADGTIYVDANGAGNIAGIATLTAVNPNGTLKWQFQFNGGAATLTSGVLSSPAIAGDGSIWVGSMDTLLYRLNPSNGAVACAISPTASSITSSPAIASDGTVYVLDVTNALFAITPSCTLKWGFQLAGFSGGDQSSPTIADDGTIWVGSQDQGLYGINPNGTLRCRAATGSAISSTPALGRDGTVYIGSDGLYAVNPSNCAVKWRFHPFLAQSSSASPVVDGEGSIYWRESFAAYALNPNGTKRWQVAMGPSGGSGLDPSAALGSLYWADGGFFDDPKRLRAFVSGPVRCKGRPATMIGTARKDKLKGSRFADVIVGLKGNDSLSGGKGNDLLCGGKGRDICSGGKGRDRAKGCERRRL